MFSLDRPLFEAIDLPQGLPLNPSLRSPTAVWVASEWLRTRLISEDAALLGGTLPTKAQTTRGWAASFATGSGRIRLAADADVLFSSGTANTGTFAVLRRSRDTTVRVGALFGYNGSSSDRVLAYAPYSDGNLYWDFGNATAGSGRLSFAFTKSTEWETLIFVAGGSKGREVWRNGVRIGSNTSANASKGSTSTAFHLGSPDGTNTCDNDDIALFVASSVAWSDAECIAWCRNPRAATFAPIPQWLPDAAGGTTYNLDLPESLSGSAAIDALIAAASAADVSASLSDSADPTLATSDAAAESLSITDAYAAAVDQLVGLIESLGPDATQDAVLAAAAAIAEALSASEAQAALLVADDAVAESASLSETQDPTPQVYGEVAEAAVTSEALEAAAALVAAVAEAGSLTEAQTTAAELVALITASATLADQAEALSANTYNVSVEELAAALSALVSASADTQPLAALTPRRSALTGARGGGRPSQTSSGRRIN